MKVSGLPCVSRARWTSRRRARSPSTACSWSPRCNRTPPRESTPARTGRRKNKEGIVKTGIALASLTLFTLFAVGCSGTEPTTPLADGTDGGALQPTGNPVVHHVSLGGADFCEALGLPTGCDANFSLVANERSDGTVTGQWHDQFAGGQGVHVAVDCLKIFGNQAIVGGVVTHSSGLDPDPTGERSLRSWTTGHRPTILRISSASRLSRSRSRAAISATRRSSPLAPFPWST